MSLTIGTAVLAGGALAAGATIYASGQAGKAQQSATNAADGTQMAMYNQTRADNMPALGARNDALAKLEMLLGVGTPGGSGFGSLGGPINPGDVTKDPGYAFGMQQGQASLDRTLNARGMRDSGAALKAAARYGSDYGTTKYDDAFNREITNRNQQLNPLLSLAGAGQVGASQIGQAGANAGNAIGSNQTALGNAMGANYIAQGNAVSNGINQLSGWYQNQQRTALPTGWASGPQSGGWYSNDTYGPQ